MDLFDIIGPVMVGPSSSHTAGAVRIGKIARMLAGEEIKNAHIKLHGSFAKTYRGHGTDRALVAGLMGFEVDDSRIKHSLDIAKDVELNFEFEEANLGNIHPNSVLIDAETKSGKKVSIIGSSVGGGSIKIIQVNGVIVEFTGEYHTLIIPHKDEPGIIALVTNVLAHEKVNIAFMKVFRTSRGGPAMMIIETDQILDDTIADSINKIHEISNATILKSFSGSENFDN